MFKVCMHIYEFAAVLPTLGLKKFGLLPILIAFLAQKWAISRHFNSILFFHLLELATLISRIQKD